MTRVSTQGNYNTALLNLFSAQSRMQDAQNRIGTQIVLNDKKWTTRQPLLRLQAAEVALARSA